MHSPDETTPDLTDTQKAAIGITKRLAKNLNEKTREKILKILDQQVLLATEPERADSQRTERKRGMSFAMIARTVLPNVYARSAKVAEGIVSLLARKHLPEETLVLLREESLKRGATRLIAWRENNPGVDKVCRGATGKFSLWTDDDTAALKAVIEDFVQRSPTAPLSSSKITQAFNDKFPTRPKRTKKAIKLWIQRLKKQRALPKVELARSPWKEQELIILARLLKKGRHTHEKMARIINRVCHGGDTVRTKQSLIKPIGSLRREGKAPPPSHLDWSSVGPLIDQYTQNPAFFHTRGKHKGHPDYAKIADEINHVHFDGKTIVSSSKLRSYVYIKSQG